MEARTLHDLLVFLEHESATGLSAKTVSEYFRAGEFDEEQFLPFLFFNDEGYARNLIHRTEEYELVALTWLPGQFTKVHDHGGSLCWSYVLSGELTFKTFSLKKGKLLEKGDPTRLAVGQTDYISDDVGLHSIHNDSAKPAVSIHLYAAPIRECSVYDADQRQMVKTDLSYFTQVGEEVPQIFLDR